MAFNPFDFFRRNQKVFFAILAIVCMFVFVLSFGAGDPFSWALAQFSGPRDQGSVVATLYGKKVHEGDLNRTQYRRQLASEFLFVNLWRQQSRVAPPQSNQLGGAFMVPAAAEGIAKLDGDLGKTAKMVLDESVRRGSRFGQIQSLAEQRDTDYAIRTNLDQLRNAMLFDRTSDGKSAYLALDANLRGALDDMVLYLQYELYRTASGSNFTDQYRGYLLNPGSNKSYYLGGNRTTEGLLDFMVWKHQADRLGIHPNDSSVLRLALAYTGTKAIPASVANFAENTTVREFVEMRRQSDRINADELLAALRDEIRVALAHETLTGRLPAGTFPALALSLVPAVPAQPSVAEGYEEFVKQTTTVDLTLLEIPVEEFLSKVEGTPSEQELQRLFDKYKKDEPNPDHGRPGFKEPRRAKVQYLTIGGTSSFIQDQAQRASSIGEAVMPVGLAALTFNPLGSTPFALPATVQAMHPHSILAEAYENRKSRGNPLESWLVEESVFGEKYGMHDSAWMRLGPTPVLIGQFLAGAGDHGSVAPLSALSAWAAKAWTYEQGNRDYYQQKLAPAALAGVFPHTALFSNLALGVLEKQKEIPQAVDLTIVLPILRQEQIARLTSGIRGGLMREAYEEIKKLRGKTEKEAKPILDKFLKDRGIESALHSTPYAEDVFELRKEPAMEDLFRLCDRVMTLGQPKPPATELGLGLALGTKGTYEPFRWGPRYDLHRLVASRQAGGAGAIEDEVGNRVLSEPDAVIVWRAEDREAMTPATLDTFVWDKDNRVKVRDKVLAGWKTLAAQTLAERHAMSVRDKLRADQGKQNLEASLQWLRDQKPGQIKEWQEASRLKRTIMPVGTGVVFEPGEVPRFVMAKPRADTLDLLLNGLKKEGDVVLIPDAPLKHWYVAVCQKRTVPSQTNYIIANHAPGMPQNRMFYSAHLVPMEERSYDEALLSRLRREASTDEERIDSNNRWRIPTLLRTNYEKSSEFGDF